MDDLAAKLGRDHDLSIGAGRPVNRASEVDRTLRESQQVLSSIRPGTTARMVHRLEDVHLRGLLTLFAGDDRLRLFVDRELDTLKEHDAERGTDLLGAVRALVTHPGSKSDAASSLHVSRPVFYDRVAKASQVLGVDLDDPDIRLSLHVAIVADELGEQLTS